MAHCEVECRQDRGGCTMDIIRIGDRKKHSHNASVVPEVQSWELRRNPSGLTLPLMDNSE